MAEPFLGEIRMVAFNFPPRYWAFCDGQLLPIRQNTRLFDLIKNKYGGDGISFFALPDLRGRTPLANGYDHDVQKEYKLASYAGTETETLTLDNMPKHDHVLKATKHAADQITPQGMLLSNSQGEPYVDSITNFTYMNSATVDETGGGDYHNNMMPFQVIHFCIALKGRYPERPKGESK